MGKRGAIKDKDADTTILYRKSSVIQSRTCSGTSELTYSKSGILQIKKKLEQSQNACAENVKRDLSIETDICILRRYCRKKMNKLSVNDSTKSKYSTVVDTQIGNIEGLQPNTSACGDSEPTDVANNIILDTTRIMMDNLKDLLNDWILKHLMSNEDTKMKIENALCSLLHKNEYDKTNTSSSGSTYILSRDSQSREKKNKKATSNSFHKNSTHKSQRKKGKRKNFKSKTGKDPSYHSSPGAHKIYRIISTLSIPRNMHKQSVYKNERNYKTTKSVKQRNLVLTINKSSKLINISSFDLLTISTKSFTKRCATYDPDGKNKKDMKVRQLDFRPNVSFKTASNSNNNYEDFNTMNKTESVVTENNVDNTQSLVKSMYAGDPANEVFNSHDKVNYSLNDDYKVTDLNISLQQISTLTVNKFQPTFNNGINKSFNSAQIKKKMYKTNVSNSTMTWDIVNDSHLFSVKNAACPHYCYAKKPSNDIKFKTKKNKRIKRKSHNRNINYNYTNHKTHLDDQPYLSLCQNTFKYLADCVGSKNMKINIAIEINPAVNAKNKDECTATGKHVTESKTKSPNFEPITMDYCKVSTTKKSLKMTAESDNKQDIHLVGTAISQPDSIFCQTNNTPTKSETDQIHKTSISTKTVIKDVPKTAGTFEEHKEEDETPQHTKTTNNLENVSKGVQFTHPLYKHALHPAKEPTEETNDTSEFYERVMRKSTSYNVIDSESIIKVTDMTSAANSTNQSGNTLRKSSSMNDTISVTQSKYVAYFFDKFRSSNSSCGKNSMYRPKTRWRECNSKLFYCSSENNCDEEDESESHNCCSNCDEEKAITFCERHMSAEQACIYGILLWLPVILVFFIYTIIVLNMPKSTRMRMQF